MKDEMDEVRTAPERARIDRGKSKLQRRDKQVIAALALTRYLTTEQVGRCFYPGVAESYPRKRLGVLAGKGGEASFQPPYLQRTQFRTYEGKLIPAWALTELGYTTAATVLGTAVKQPRTEVGADFMEHTVTLSEVWVRLARPFLAAGVKVARLPFRWAATESVRLSWTEYDVKTGEKRNRLIVPDTVLEVPAARRRYFIECEMGTHSIVSDAKAGATLSKAESYDEYMSGYAEPAERRTWYSLAYPDGLPAEVLFVVRVAARERSVNEALARWRQGRRVALPMKATTLDAVELELRGLLPTPVAVASSAPVTGTGARPAAVAAEDVHALREFYQQALHRLDAAGAPIDEGFRAIALKVRDTLTRMAAPSASRKEARS